MHNTGCGQRVVFHDKKYMPRTRAIVKRIRRGHIASSTNQIHLHLWPEFLGNLENQVVGCQPILSRNNLTSLISREFTGPKSAIRAIVAIWECAVLPLFPRGVPPRVLVGEGGGG